MTVPHFWKGIHLQVYQLHLCHRRSLQSEGNEVLHLKSSQTTNEASLDRHKAKVNPQDRLAVEILHNYDSNYAGPETSKIIQEYSFCFTTANCFWVNATQNYKNTDSSCERHQRKKKILRGLKGN